MTASFSIPWRYDQILASCRHKYIQIICENSSLQKRVDRLSSNASDLNMALRVGLSSSPLVHFKQALIQGVGQGGSWNRPPPLGRKLPWKVRYKNYELLDRKPSDPLSRWGGLTPFSEYLGPPLSRCWPLWVYVHFWGVLHLTHKTIPAFHILSGKLFFLSRDQPSLQTWVICESSLGMHSSMVVHRPNGSYDSSSALSSRQTENFLHNYPVDCNNSPTPQSFLCGAALATPLTIFKSRKTVDIIVMWVTLSFLGKR